MKLNKPIALIGALLLVSGCSSTKVDTLKGTSPDFMVEAKFTNGVLTELNENGDLLSEEDIKNSQNNFTYMGEERDMSPMLYYFEAVNKTMDEVGGELTLNGKPYKEQRSTLFEEEFKTKSCALTEGTNSVNVSFLKVNDTGFVEELEIEFSSQSVDESKKSELLTSYLNMLNSMFGEGKFTTEDFIEESTESSYIVSVAITSQLLQEREMQSVDLLDMLYSLKLNEFECKGEN